MNRGEVWKINSLGRVRAVLVVGNVAEAPEVRAHPIAVDIGPHAETVDSILNVRIYEPLDGVITVPRIGRYRRELFTDYLGALDTDTMASVDTALRAALDL